MKQSALLPSLRGNPQGLTKQSIKTAKSQVDFTESFRNFTFSLRQDSALIFKDFIIACFRKKGCTPSPLPYAPNSSAVSLLGESLANSRFLHKKSGGTSASFFSLFMHHEAEREKVSHFVRIYFQNGLPRFCVAESRNDEIRTQFLQFCRISQCDFPLTVFARATPEAIHKDNPLIKNTNSQVNSIKSLKNKTTLNVYYTATKDGIIKTPRNATHSHTAHTTLPQLQRSA